MKCEHRYSISRETRFSGSFSARAKKGAGERRWKSEKDREGKGRAKSSEKKKCFAYSI